MKQYTAGFLGAGNMGGALAQAAIRTVGAENVILTCKTEAHTRAAAERLGCASGQAAEIIRSSRSASSRRCSPRWRRSWAA